MSWNYLLFFCPGKNKDNFFYPVNGLLADTGCTLEPCKIGGVVSGFKNGRARVSQSLEFEAYTHHAVAENISFYHENALI
jgi:hypothetical protein